MTDTWLQTLEKLPHALAPWRVSGSSRCGFTTSRNLGAINPTRAFKARLYISREKMPGHSRVARECLSVSFQASTQVGVHHQASNSSNGIGKKDCIPASLNQKANDLVGLSNLHLFVEARHVGCRLPVDFQDYVTLSQAHAAADTF